MPQQINLCTPILLTQKRYFSAQTMVIALGVFVVLGGVLCGVWVWNLQHASDGFRQTMGTQAGEIDGLKAAIERSRASAGPADAALLAQLKDQRSTLAHREQLLDALQEGLFRPDEGHSDRLQWVARSIPSPVWITSVRLEGARFEVTGFTLEPAALNDWVARLASSPLMQDLKLATVQVDNATVAPVRAPGAAALTPVASPRPVWSFRLVSATPALADGMAAVGGQP